MPRENDPTRRDETQMVDEQTTWQPGETDADADATTSTTTTPPPDQP